MENLKTYALKYSIPILSLIAVFISIYLLYVHYSPMSLACPDVGIINCSNVLTSSYSSFFGIPLPIFGLLYFILLIVLSFIKKTDIIILILSTISLFIVAALLYIEFGLIHSVCLYCSSIHLIAISIFFISLYKYLFRANKTL
jgi:uncharacterized membrane protein